MSSECEFVQERLLDHVYGALEDADDAKITAHVRACGPCRAALATARAQSETMATAAREAAEDVRFAAPPRSPLVPRTWMKRTAAVLVAAAALGGGAWLHQRSGAGASVLRTDISGPRQVASGAPAEFVVRLDGAGAGPTTVGATLRRLRGSLPLAVRVDDATATAHVAVPGDALAPGEQAPVVFEVASGAARATAVLRVRDATRIAARASTDKPLYRPGEVVRIRGVALENLHLTPAGDSRVRLRIVDPSGTTVVDRELVTQTGVSAWEHALPADAPGGRWKAIVESPQKAQGSVLAHACPFDVRTYRVPRLRFDAAFDRTSFRPGDKGTALLLVTRAEGAPPAGAKADAVLTVDGREIERKELALAADGTLAVPFQLPPTVEEGFAELSVTVADGGNVETTAKTIPLVVDRVKVEAFPEGGRLVSGLPQRVYLRATTPRGEPADVELEVVEDKAVVAAARTEVRGMAVVEWTPKAWEDWSDRSTPPTVTFRVRGRALRVDSGELVAEDGTTTLRSLDDVVAAGAPVRVRVASRRAGRHTVGVWCRGSAVGDATLDLAAGVPAEVSVPVRTDAGGVLRVTVFDAAGVPVAERLVASEPRHRLDVEITPDRARVAPGAKVTVGVRVRDETGAAAQAVLGTCVVDEGVLALAGGEGPPSMPLHYLLAMDVDALERAQVYARGAASARAIDLLLGVQGWRRFAWKDPAAFAASHPDAGARVAPVALDETPQAWSNADRAEQVRASEARRIDRRWRSRFAAAGVLSVIVALVTLGLRAAMRSPSRAWLVPAVGTAFVLLFIVGTVVAVVPEMGVVTLSASAGAVAGEELPAEAVIARMAMPRMGGFSMNGGGGGDGARVAGRARVDAWLRSRSMTTNSLDPIGYIGGPLDSIELLDRAELPDLLVREYAHQGAVGTAERDDFTEVLHWNPLLVTDAEGRASFSFETSDLLTEFRIQVDAHEGGGALGAGSARFANVQPLSAEPKLPAVVSTGDVVRVPVVVANDAGTGALVRLSVTGASGQSSAALQVASGARGRAMFELHPVAAGVVPFVVDAEADGGLHDRVSRSVTVEERGYPHRARASGSLADTASAEVELPTGLVGAPTGSLRFYPGAMATLLDGLDGMLAEPHGCFEQVSSTNYPNVLVLDLLRDRSGDGPTFSPDVARRSQELLASGYRQLVAYECKSGGFEWFGSDPGHEALTAYGLMEFADMARVFDVDTAMTARARAWLLSRRDGKGGFQDRGHALHGWGAVPKGTTDAYVVWALVESDPRGAKDIAAELDALAARARTSKDAYLVALAANAFVLAGRPEADATVAALVALQDARGAFPAPASTVLRSGEQDAEVETAALAAAAFSRAGRAAEAEAAARFLLTRRNGGCFGATQATVLALRALAIHTRAAPPAGGTRDVTILVNGTEIAKRSVPADALHVVSIEASALGLVPGRNVVELRSAGGGAPLPWALTVDSRTRRPPSDADAPLSIAVSLDRTDLREGDTAIVTAVVRNRGQDGVSMPLVRVGLPAGLEPRADALEEMRKAGEVAFYELRPREVTFYLHGLDAGGERALRIPCVASIPGSYEGPASAAYLYYAPQAKSWAAPISAEISER